MTEVGRAIFSVQRSLLFVGSSIVVPAARSLHRHPRHEGSPSCLIQFPRREFVGDTAKIAFGAAIVPRFVLGGPGYKAPSAKLNIACVGIGGMGMSNFAALLDENIVAICDVDFPYVERSLANRLNPPRGQTASSPESLRLKAAYDKATKYNDYREMLVKERDIDAVVIATPDHMHASIAFAAMSAGKHVYVQKPLTYSVAEARLLAKTAADKKLVTQMGNQGHSRDGTRRIKEIVASGFAWCDQGRARVDRSSGAVLGAGDTASADVRATRSRVQSQPRGCTAQPCVTCTVEQRHCRQRSAQSNVGNHARSAGRFQLGQLPRRRAGDSVSSRLPSVCVAWMGGLWCWCDW